MSVNREELKRMIDKITEEDAAQVFDFIGYLNFKRGEVQLPQSDIQAISEDPNLIRQVLKSREDRETGRYYAKDKGLMYLRENTGDNERE